MRLAGCHEVPVWSTRSVSPRTASHRHAGCTEPPADQEGGAPENWGSWSWLSVVQDLSRHLTRHRRDQVIAMELAECGAPQPSSNQDGWVHGFLSFPFCKVRILISPGCLGDAAKQVKRHCPAGWKWELCGGRATSPPVPMLLHFCLVLSGGAYSPVLPLPTPLTGHVRLREGRRTHYSPILQGGNWL